MLHWYVALAVVLGLSGVFVAYVARNSRREWLKSGRTAAEYDDRLGRNRRRHLPLVLLIAVLFLLGRHGVLPDQVARYFPLVPVVVFVPLALYDLWKNRSRIAQDKSWRATAFWHAALLLMLLGVTWLVMPFLLSLP
jgi:cytochrome bd-type quinol oxidase subunit 2